MLCEKGRKATKVLVHHEDGETPSVIRAVPFDIDQRAGGLVFQVHRFRLWRRSTIQYRLIGLQLAAFVSKRLSQIRINRMLTGPPGFPSPENSPFGPRLVVYCNLLPSLRETSFLTVSIRPIYS